MRLSSHLGNLVFCLVKGGLFHFVRITALICYTIVRMRPGVLAHEIVLCIIKLLSFHTNHYIWISQQLWVGIRRDAHLIIESAIMIHQHLVLTTGVATFIRWTRVSMHFIFIFTLSQLYRLISLALISRIFNVIILNVLNSHLLREII